MRFPMLGTATAAVLVAAFASAEEAEVSRGEYLVHAGGCIVCHTDEGKQAIPLVGGRSLETPFGTFYSPNITPDPTTGIGEWTDENFLRAFWEGVNPDGDHYYPAFPFTSYTGISREDLLAMKAYLFRLEPVANPTPEHDLALYISTRLAAGEWKLLNFNVKNRTKEFLNGLIKGDYWIYFDKQSFRFRLDIMIDEEDPLRNFSKADLKLKKEKNDG